MIQLKKYIKTNRFAIIAVCILALGCFLRLYKIADYPVGLNQDEASIGYEAYSIAHYGIDRNGNSLPVHLVAWGSGQNALYAYLILPFTYFVQNDTLAIRLPMALVGCLTLIICAVLIKNFSKNKYGLLALFILAVFPWHIMKSRWGLESNLFPDLVLWGIIAIYYGLQRKKHRYFIVSSVIFGLSTYAYGPAYVFVPLLLLLFYGCFVLRKRAQLKWTIFYIALTGLVALPMIVFVFINYFDLHSVSFFGVTIPKLDFNRFTEITSVNGNFIINCINNLLESTKIIFSQEDGLGLNTIPFFGVLYFFSMPFCIYGIIISLKNIRSKEDLYEINILWLISSLVICAMVEPNINRINSIWFPLQIFAIIGIIDLTRTKKLFYYTISITYILSSVLFIGYYFTIYQQLLISPNYLSLKNAAQEAIDSDYDKLYFTNSLNQPYIYYLLISKMSPAEYIADREIPEYHTMLQKVESIGNVYFATPDNLERGDSYIVPSSKVHAYDFSKVDCIISNYQAYSVIDCTE